jgi:hypothetical protein
MMVEIDGVKGAKAHADLVDVMTGLVIGGAEAYCMRDEERWGTRPKYEWQEGKRVKVGDEIVPWFQLASMAQTRAGAKAFRNRLAWVVVLAGYRPTPAEEMTESTVNPAVEERRTVDKSQHWCELHKVSFFKKGGMKGYAHSLEGGGWCNEPEASPQVLSSTPEKQEPVASKEQAGSSQPEDIKSPSVETDWLKEALDIIHWKETTAKSWIRAQLKVPTEGNLTAILNSLDKDKLKMFVTHISEMREAAGRQK